VGFGSWQHYCTDVTRRKSTKLCTMFGRLPGWYTICTFSGPKGIFPGAKFTLCPSLAFSYICTITARHSSSGHQPNFTAFSRECHLYSAGRPSHWALAHILVVSLFMPMNTWWNDVSSFDHSKRMHTVPNLGTRGGRSRCSRLTQGKRGSTWTLTFEPVWLVVCVVVSNWRQTAPTWT